MGQADRRVGAGSIPILKHAGNSHDLFPLTPTLSPTGTIQINSMERGGRAQRRRRFCLFCPPQSHTPNGSSDPNRSATLPLPKGDGWGEREERVQLHRYGWCEGGRDVRMPKTILQKLPTAQKLRCSVGPAQ